MKYMLLIFQNPATLETLSEDELRGLMNEAGTIMEELQASGEWIAGEALADPSAARSVRARDGVPVVTDGPYLEAKEHLAGVCIFECETLERATEIAARWPDARLTGVELRPLMSEAGTEM
jgi:hypothetical protein